MLVVRIVEGLASPPGPPSCTVVRKSFCFNFFCGLPSTVPLFGDEDPDTDDDPRLVVFVRLFRSQTVVPYGAIGNPNPFFRVMVVQCSHGAEVVVFLTSL